MSGNDTPERRSRELSTTECRARLQSHTIGRVGWNAGEGPQILPVAYVVRDGMVAFRTSPYGALGELRLIRHVAFEVDEYDGMTRTGWSVLVRGTARPAVDAEELTRLWQSFDPVPWADGARNMFITITLDQVTGREISS
jgi:nitroimidazol reductase NimA-like FMN-containing flavoprotein (pyridoxamine 5'-phosphate oxidase superfamily)